ncbi:unnamed protein product, partial [Ectocarpus sp. 4 AP-2014]
YRHETRAPFLCTKLILRTRNSPPTLLTRDVTFPSTPVSFSLCFEQQRALLSVFTAARCTTSLRSTLASCCLHQRTTKHVFQPPPQPSSPHLSYRCPLRRRHQRRESQALPLSSRKRHQTHQPPTCARWLRSRSAQRRHYQTLPTLDSNYAQRRYYHLLLETSGSVSSHFFLTPITILVAEHSPTLLL